MHAALANATRCPCYRSITARLTAMSITVNYCVTSRHQQQRRHRHRQIRIVFLFAISTRTQAISRTFEYLARLTAHILTFSRTHICKLKITPAHYKPVTHKTAAQTQRERGRTICLEWRTKPKKQPCKTKGISHIHTCMRLQQKLRQAELIRSTGAGQSRVDVC